MQKGGLMKRVMIYLLLACLLPGLCSPAFGGSKPGKVNPKTNPATQVPSKSTKGITVLPGPFRVNKVIFKQVTYNNKTYLAAGVFFNRNLDKASVQKGINISMITKNENNFWVNASSQNTIRINPDSIIWTCGTPLKTGYYKMYLKGTLKSADGIYLDCNGDGKGEGGYLPAYESQLYYARVIQIDLQEQNSPLPDDMLQHLKDER